MAFNEADYKFFHYIKEASHKKEKKGVYLKQHTVRVE